MAEKKKATPWRRPRHRVITAAARVVVGTWVRLKYHITVEPYKGKGPVLIVSNHQTGADQFIVGMGFSGPLYYVASEDLFSNGFVSTLLKFAVAPIPIKKQSADLSAVRNCMKVAKEGGSIAVFPEGNRTFGGRTGYMKPAIAKLARALKLPVVFYHIEGGYGVHPRWSDCVRRGKMRAYVSAVLSPEEVRAMGDEALYERMQKELWQDEAVVDGTYTHKNAAEYLERAMYVCPFCGLSEFESGGDIIACKRCGRKIRYLPTKELEGVGFEFPYRFVADWYDAQCDYINHLDLTRWDAGPIYDETAAVYRVTLYERKELAAKEASVRLYGDHMEFSFGDETHILSFADISTITVLGKNKLNVYCGDEVWQFKGSKRFNALKYMNICFRRKNMERGDDNDGFLGL